MILAVNIWCGEYNMNVIVELRREINKRRWARWRARHAKAREKPYFYCTPPPSPWTCAPDHDCIPEGLCILCANTLHEAACESDQKGTFLAYSWGNVDITTGLCPGGTGGNCWAAAIYTSDPMYIPSNFKIKAKVELNGRCSTSGGVKADLAIFIEVESLGISDKVYYVNAAELSGGKKEWHQEYLNLWTPEHTATPGNYEIKVRIRGQGTCCGEGTYAAAEFNNRYGDGFYVKLWDIYVQGV